MGPKLFVLFALVASSLAGPIVNSETCSRRCTETNKFGYLPGKTYEYDYNADVDTSIQGASEDKSGMQFTAKVYIDVVSKCEMNLRLGNVRLLESNPKDPATKIDADKTGEFRTSMEETTLAFSFQDGRIEELCSQRPEKTWVLNIKRGIISSLQNSMDDLTQDQKVQETDVTGECKAEYVVSNNGWYTKTIKKSKDLLACENRHGYNTMMQGTPYKASSEIQSLPLVKGSHECSQEITKAGILKNSVCEEQHVLRPFSRDSSGAITKTTQTLTYVTERTSSLSSVPVGERFPLTFVHANDGRGSLSEVEGKLNEICISTTDKIQPDSPKLFLGLVHLMKALESEELRQMYEKVKQNRLCPSNKKRVEKFFLDAIPMLGTKASVRMMTSLINNKEVSGIEADMWLTTLSFIKSPTKDMLREIKPLVGPEANEKALLGVSSLVYAYCQKESCENDLEIASIVSAIEDKIGVGCYVDKNNLNQVVMSLRALGNAGFVSNVVPTITKCMSKEDNPTEVRLSAIQAFRRMPCSIPRDDVMAVFRNKEEDSELRIAAYLALMTCPSDTILSRVRFLLESEEVNQVGSFVWSHLNNLMETSSPLKQEIRTIISDQELKKEFDLEKLKYSRNYEGSFFLEKLNTGASIDSNLVWSSKSFLPRSAMTNITFDLFGHSVNLLEIGGRIEGIEYFLESYFGPNGYFQEDAVKEATKQSINGISERKMDDINRQFGSEMDALKGDLYMRVFGNELMFARFSGLRDITDGKTINILDILTSLAKNKQYSFTQNYMFLDSSMIIPTIAGFPMNLTIDGSATIDLQASGKMDFRKLTTRSPSISVNGHIKPSGSVLVNSMMSVDAFVTKTGMKMVSTMASSSSIDGHIELENGKVLSAQINTPFDKMEVFNVKTAFFTVHREAEREQKMITENKQTKKICSGDKFAKITGLELCGELQYPNASLKSDAPYFPMTGPISAGITLYKRDSHASYNFEYKFVKTRNEGRARLAFSTPGSKVDREMSIDFLVRPDPVVELNLISPWKRASVRGAVVGDNKQKQITGRVVIDDKQEYSVTGEWVKSRKGNLYKYQPYIEIIIPDMENIKLSSNVELVTGKSFDGEITLKGLSKHPIHSKVNLISKKSMTSVKTSISFEAGKDYSMETRLQRTDTKKATKLMPFLSIRTPKQEVAALGGSLEYKSGALILVDITLDRVLDKTVKIFTKFQRTPKKSGTRFQSKTDIRTPFLRTKGTSNIVIQRNAVVTRISYDYVIPRIARDKVTVNSKVNYGFTKTVWSLKGNGEVAFKRSNDYNVFITTDISNKRRITNVNFDMRYGPKRKDENKQILVSSLIRHELGWKASDLDINADVKYLALGVDMKIKGSHSHTYKNLKSNIGVVFGKKQSMSAALNLKNKSKRYISLIGDGSLKWNDQSFSLANNFEQKNRRNFRNEITANIAGHKTKAVSDLKLADSEYDVSTDITMTGRSPVHLEAKINLDPREFRIHSQYNNDHSISIGSQYKRAALLRLSGDVTLPSRRVTAEFEAKKKNPAYLGHLDIKWDANVDKGKGIYVDTQLDFKNGRDVNGFLLIRSPLQNNKINMNRKGNNAHFDIKSYGKEQLSVDTELKQTSDNSLRQIMGSMTVTTASKMMRFVKVDLDLQSDPSEYRTNFDVSWKPDNRVSAAFTLKHPIHLRHLEGSFNLKTPFDGYKSSSLEFAHTFGDDLKSVVEVQLNKQSVKLDLSAKTEMQAYVGHVGIKSSIPSIRAISIDARHQSMDKTNENSLVLDLNGKVYTYEGKLTHDRIGWMVHQTGKVLLVSPSYRYDTTWTHRNTLNDVETEVTSHINRDIYSFNVKGKHNLAWKEATIQYTLTSSGPSEKLQLSFSHSHQGNSLDTIVTMSENRRNIFTNEIHLQTQNGQIVMTGNVLYKNKQQLAYEGRLKTGNVKFLKVTVSTPFSSFRRFSSELEFTGDIRSMSSSAIVELQPIMGRVKMVSTLNRIGGVSGNLRLETPFNQLPSSEITFSRRPEEKKMRTDVKIEYLPGRILTLTTRTLFEGQKMAADVSIATPFEKLRRFTSAVTHNPTNKGCVTSIDFELPENVKYSGELTLEFKSNYYSSLVIRLPEMDPIIASLNHKGSWEQFVSRAHFQYSKERKHEADFSFSNARKIEVLFNIKSPLCEDMSASISHTGNLNKGMSSNGMVKYGNKKPATVDLDWVNSKRMRASLKIKSPFMDDITFSLNHKGKPTNFKSKTKFGWGQKNEVEGDLSFTFVRNNLKADVSISTPFKSFRKMSAFITHEGKLRNFKCQSGVKIGKNSWNANLKSKLDPSLSAEIAVETPHNGFESLRVAYTQDGHLSDFISKVEVSKNKEEVTGDLKFTANPFIFSASLQTPIDNYRSLKTLISHTGSIKNFKTKAEVTYASYKTITFDSSISAESPITASVTVKTPFAGFEEMAGKITHSGSMNNFASRMETLHQKKRSQLDISFTSLGPIEGKLTLLTPDYEMVKMVASHSFEPSIKSNIKMTYGAKSIVEGSLSFMKEPKLKGDISFISPYIPSVTGAFEHSGNFENSKTKFNAVIGGKRSEFDLVFRSDGDLSLILNLNTPFKQLRTGKFELNHRGQINNFETIADVDVNSRNARGVLKFSSSNGIEGSAKLTTPFKSLRDAELHFKHSGYLQDFECNAEYIQDGMKAEGQLALRTVNGVNGRAFLRTPYFDGITLTMTHSGDWRKFLSKGDLSYGYKDFSTQLSVDLTKNVMITGYLKSPYTSDIVFNTATNGFLTSEMRSTSQLTYNGAKQHDLELTYKIQPIALSFLASYNKKISVDMKLDIPNGLDDRIELTAQLNTPVSEPISIALIHTSNLKQRVALQTNIDVTYSGRKQHDIMVEFQYKGDITVFETSGKVIYNGKSTAVEANLDSSNGLKGKCVLRTPISEDIIISINHKNFKPLNFETQGELTYSGQIQHHISLTFDHDGSLKKFKTSASVSYNKKDFSADIYWNVLRDPEGSITVRTPFTEDMTASVVHQGVLNDFVSHGEIGYSGRKQHDVNVVFKNGDSRKFGEVTYNTKTISLDSALENLNRKNINMVLKTPFTEDIIVTGDFNGDLLNFNTRGDISYSGKKQHEASLAFEHVGSISNFRTTLSATYNSKTISSEIEFDSTIGLKAKGILRTPYTNDIEAVFDYSGKPDDFQTNTQISYRGEKQHDMVIKFKGTGTLKKFEGSFEGEYNTKRISADVHLDLITGNKFEGRLATPFTEEIRVFVDNQGMPSDFKSRADVTYSGSKQYDVTISFKLAGTLDKFQLNNEVEYNTKRTSLTAVFDTTNGIVANVNLKTPVWSDIQFDISAGGNIPNLDSRAELTFSGKSHTLKCNLNLQGDRNDFTATGKASYNEKEFSFDVKLDTTDGIDGKAILKIPNTDDIVFVLKHDGNLLNFDSRSELSYNGNKQFEITGNMKHTGRMENFRSVVLFTYNGKAASSEISIDMTDGVEGKIEVVSPYSGVKAGISHRFDGTLRRFRTTTKLTMNEKELNAETQFDITKGLDAKVVLQTPFPRYENNMIKIKVLDRNLVLSVNGEIRIRNKRATLNAKIERSNGLDVEFCLKTPYTEDFEILLNGNGNLHSFKYDSSVSYGDQKIKGTVNHLWSFRAVEGSMSLETPILDTIKVDYDFNGNLQLFESTVKASIGDMNSIKEITRLRLGETFLDLDSTVTTTLSGQEKTSQLIISHNGGLSNFKANIKASHGNKDIQMDASFKNNPSIEATFSLQTPFQQLRNIKGKLEHTGSLRAFTVSSSLEYGLGQKIIATSTIDLQRLQRISLTFDVQTPFSIVPHLNGRYRHDLRSDSLTSSAYLSLMENKPILNSNLKLTSKMVDFLFSTPTNRYSVNGELSIRGETYNFACTAVRGIEKITIRIEKSPVSLTLDFNTPIRGYESTKIRASGSKSPYYGALNIQGTYMSEIDFETRFNKELEGSLKLKTGFTNLRDIRMNINAQRRPEIWEIHFDGFFNNLEGINLDASVSDRESSLSLSTPWQSLRMLKGSLKYGKDDQRSGYNAATNLKINEEVLYDVDFEIYAKEKTIVVNVNEPKPMRFEINKIGESESFILVNWNKIDRESSCKLEQKYNDDWSFKKQIVSFRGMCGSRSYGIGASYEKPGDAAKYSTFVSQDEVKSHAFEVEHKRSSGKQDLRYRLQLPTRTLVLTTSEDSLRYGSNSFESSFLWDADRDNDKRTTVKITASPRGDTDNVNLALEMPSIGKDFKLDTQVRVNSGNVIFDGRTEFKYSPDSRKTLTLNSKLEDVSGRGEHYNFLFGISHPYTTVDVQTKAEFGKSDDKFSAGFDIKYMTARRQMKNIALMTEIDKLKRQLNVEVRSPVKSMRMDASVETSPYKLSIRNLYDDTKPINTELTVDPNKASVDFNMNYDLDNPENTLHVNAMFSDEKGISAELYRDEYNKKIVDSLLNIRLKTSKILHTRVQWRPSMIRDLKEALTVRAERYGMESDRALINSYDEIQKEISYKRRLFQAAYSEEVKPYTEALREKLGELRQLKDQNAYYLGDIYGSLETVMVGVSDLAQEFEEAWNRCPIKQNIDQYMTRLNELQQSLNDLSRDVYIGGDNQLNSIGSSSYQKLLDSVNSVKNHHMFSTMRTKYQTYMDKLHDLKMNDQLSNIANQYTSTIYNVRENINNRLLKTLPTPVYNLGSSAYTHWEMEENTKALIDRLIVEIKNDAAKEMSFIKDVFKNVLKSKVIVYDLNRGEIEFDLYLPVDVNSLRSISDISLRKYIPDVKSYLPDTNMFGSLEDYVPHMEFTGHAKVDGSHFTTFDGQQFDFSGRCSYVLAGDYVDGNFSIILNYLGRQKKKLILTAHHQNIQLAPSGKVRVDGVVMDLPYKSSDFAVFAEDGRLVIEGRGFQVISDFNVDKVDIDLSKWYFGKTGGLLGTLNHERYDDMMMPNKRITEDVYTLANAWQVQDRCR